MKAKANYDNEKKKTEKRSHDDDDDDNNTISVTCRHIVVSMCF